MSVPMLRRRLAHEALVEMFQADKEEIMLRIALLHLSFSIDKSMRLPLTTILDRYRRPLHRTFDHLPNATVNLLLDIADYASDWSC